MTTNEYVCRDCEGLGEVAIEPGGDGYAPVYVDCELCNGLGYEVVDPEEMYSEDISAIQSELAKGYSDYIRRTAPWILSRD